MSFDLTGNGQIKTVSASQLLMRMQNNDDQTPACSVHNCRGHRAGLSGMHQPIRSYAAFRWRRSDRRRQRGCNRGCRCRWSRRGSRGRSWRSCRGGHGPYHDTTSAGLLWLQQQPTLRTVGVLNRRRRGARESWGCPFDDIRINECLMTAQNSHTRATAHRDRREI